jgi:hypothetical protein
VAIAALAIVPVAATAQTTAAPLPLVAVASPVQDANQASAEARSLRRDVASMLQGYLDDYGDRFTGDERQQLVAYRADADRQLAAVVVTTGRLSRALTTGASATERRIAAVAAASTWKRAKRVADASWTSARQIMEPRLSLFEKLGALRDYDAMMGRFDDLGDRITAASAGGP